MTSAVIRVKRRITDEPFDKFVLNSKRFKTSNDDEIKNADPLNQTINTSETDNKRTILKLAATINADDDINTHISRLRKGEAEELARKVRKTLDVSSKLRQQLKNDAQNQRFKIVNCFRSIENETEETTSEKCNKNITVVDVIKEDLTLKSKQDSKESEKTTEISPTANEQTQKDSEKFVYDLYLVSDGEQLTEIDINQFISIRPFDDLVYQANDELLNDTDYDSEDSNEEAHWRNEYPDTDDDFSVGEDDMRRAVEDLNIASDEDNLSTDDESDYGRDPVVHFMDESNEYDYFKKHGRIASHNAYYRDGNAHKARCDEDDDEDDEDIESTSPASSIASPLVSCDDMSDNE